MDNYHIYSDLLLAAMIGVILVGIRVLHANSRILTRVDLREQRVQEDLAARALALEEKTARIANEIRIAVEQKDAEAKVRHDIMIKASLDAAEAARIAAIQAAATKEDVHKLVLSQKPEADAALLAVSEDTNVTVHEIKQHVADESKKNGSS